MMMRPSRIGSPTLDPIEEEKCNSDDEELLEVQGTPELEVQGPEARTGRQRKPPARLQVDGRNKTYQESRVSVDDTDGESN